MTVTLEQFRQAMGHFATGVTIVTTQDDQGQPYGLTVNSFTSVSLNPMLVLVCLDSSLSGLEAFKKSNKFAVNVLSEDQQDLSNYFAQSGTDRSQAAYIPGKTGIPLLEGVLATLECEIVKWYRGGDHAIMLGEVQQAETTQSDKKPLLFLQGRYRHLQTRIDRD